MEPEFKKTLNALWMTMQPVSCLRDNVSKFFEEYEDELEPFPNLNKASKQAEGN